MKETKHERQMRNLKAAFCGCKSYSVDPKDHKLWCPFSIWKLLKPQPKKEQEEAEGE